MENFNDYEGLDFNEESIFEDNQEPQPIVEEQPDIFGDPFEETEKSAFDLFLESKGIIDSKIKIVNDDNSEEEVDFTSLSKEEQLDILNSLTTEVKTQEPASQQSIKLSVDEQEFFKQLNQHGISLEQFLENYKSSILNETEPSYDIDSYNDQELFLLDLKNKYDLTEEELTAELERELQNEDLFKKKIDKIRNEYKELENQYKAEQAAEFEANQKKEYDQFVEQVVTVASNVPEFHGVELDDDEKNGALSYLLDLNEQGVSQFYNDLNDTNKLYEVALYLKYGADVIKLIQDTYESEINKLKAQLDKPRAVRQDTRNSKKIETINDLI